jgi:hypothetical protein
VHVDVVVIDDVCDVLLPFDGVAASISGDDVGISGESSSSFALTVADAVAAAAAVVVDVGDGDRQVVVVLVVLAVVGSSCCREIIVKSVALGLGGD